MRPPKCTFHNCHETAPNADHERKYHRDVAVKFTSKWDGAERVVHRSQDNMAYYCDHPNCQSFTYLTSGPLQHHGNCPWYKSQHNETPVEGLISSSYSTLAPAAPSHAHTVDNAASCSNAEPSSKKEESSVVKSLDDFQASIEAKLRSVVVDAVETSPTLRKHDRDITNLFVELHKVRRSIDQLNWNLNRSNALLTFSESTPTRELSPIMQLAPSSWSSYVSASPASTSQTANLPGSLASGVSEKDFSGLEPLSNDLETSIGEGVDEKEGPHIEFSASDIDKSA
ncbi:unnamed protein product [Mortierella alpina]